MKIAILVCYNPTLVNFRLDMMLEMIRLGHQQVPRLIFGETAL